MNSSYEVLKNRLTNGVPYTLEEAMERINYLADTLVITNEQREELTALAEEHASQGGGSYDERITALEDELAATKILLGVE